MTDPSAMIHRESGRNDFEIGDRGNGCKDSVQEGVDFASASLRVDLSIGSWTKGVATIRPISMPPVNWPEKS